MEDKTFDQLAKRINFLVLHKDVSGLMVLQSQLRHLTDMGNKGMDWLQSYFDKVANDRNAE